MTSAPVPGLDRLDGALAAACALAALAGYLRTLAPGVTADVDTALFQFLGRVLGVAHNPGYPLYALLTWPVAPMSGSPGSATPSSTPRDLPAGD